MHPRNAQFTRIRHGSTPDLKYRPQRRRWPEMRSGSCLLRLLRRLVHRGLGKADWRVEQEDMQPAATRQPPPAVAKSKR